MKSDLMKTLAEARPASLEPADDPDRMERIIAAATARPSEAMPPRRSSRSRRSRMRTVWVMGAVAAGVVAAVTLIPDGGRSADPAARGLLLAAAEQTINEPASTGRYWHTKGVNVGGFRPSDRSHGVCRDETWVARSPQDPSWWVVNDWTRMDAVKGAPPPPKGGFSSDQAHFACNRGTKGISNDKNTTPYAVRLNNFAEPGSSWPNVNGKPVSVEDIERLPTEPEELKETLIRWQVPSAKQDEILFDQAAELLLDLPTPAPVRAALFRLLADLPGVRSLGDVRDPLGRAATGVALRECESRYGAESRILFDKGTGRLLSLAKSVGEQGCADLRPAGWSAVLTSGWTDETPKVPAD
ncbi:CU044_5270 family protein [Nonomuraea purpurea]|uniref:CU044_5270 family protein n=1 Tax=Nonomuraea purpurea TaxID=1849276 RepID=A0ABV8GBL1_9ACTN